MEKQEITNTSDSAPAQAVTQVLPPVEDDSVFETHNRIIATWLHYNDGGLLIGHRSEPFAGRKLRVFFRFKNGRHCKELIGTYLLADQQVFIRKWLASLKIIDDIIHNQ